jgi:hypothetical protein
MVWRKTFPGTPDQARLARRFTEALFAGTGREEDAGLIIAELVGNAILYTDSGQPGGWFGVECATRRCVFPDGGESPPFFCRRSGGLKLEAV